MRTLLFLFCFPFLIIETFGQTEVASQIERVKVFKQSAQITRNLSFTTVSGNQEIVLTGISTQIIPSSLQIQLNNTNLVLLSAKYENNYLLPKTNNEQVEKLKLQLAALNDELAWLNDQKNSLKGMETILNKNQDLGNGGASFTAQQVVELSNTYQTKYLEIRKKLRELAKKEQPLRDKVNNITKQLNEYKAKFNRPSGSVILQLSAKISQVVAIKCKYMVNNVGWRPIYDIRSEGITKNVQLNYKANIYQNTGVDWKDISVVVSTGNPSQNNNRPILSPLYARVYQKEALIDELDINAYATNSYIKKSKKFKGYTEEKDNQLNIEFNVLNKQTINSDAKENLVALKEYELNTEYIYHSVPKLNSGVFLLAKISNWSQYNLVTGNANIFFEGSFVGTSQINPQVTSDTLVISMGRDNNVVVERIPINNFTSSKFIGANKKETIGFELIIKNKKSVPIKLDLLDQIPISQNSLIEVTLEEKGKAAYSQDIGKLLWTITLDPRQTKKVSFRYTVKYPKKESVTGVR